MPSIKTWTEGKSGNKVVSYIVSLFTFMHHGSKFQCASLDMSKAFDMVDHGQVFETVSESPQPCYLIFAAVVQLPASGDQVE